MFAEQPLWSVCPFQLQTLPRDTGIAWIVNFAERLDLNGGIARSGDGEQEDECDN